MKDIALFILLGLGSGAVSVMGDGLLLGRR